MRNNSVFTKLLYIYNPCVVDYEYKILNTAS